MVDILIGRLAIPAEVEFTLHVILQKNYILLSFVAYGIKISIVILYSLLE